jgi:GGDEF domain-containing protein
MAIRIDADADAPLVRRVVLQVVAVLGDPDRAYRLGPRTFAVSLYEADRVAARLLAERIRLMVAAMPSSAAAPTVTIVVAECVEPTDETLPALEAALDAHRAIRNRVITP